MRRETRLFLDMRGPVEGNELKMFVEGDFYGSGSAFRLRHAYGSYGGLLAGQTWSVFVDDNNFPNTIDFESPMAFPSVRQAQLRWTQKLRMNSSWSAAVEDNKSTIAPPAHYQARQSIRCRTWSTRVRFGASRGHAFASVFLGKARFRPTGGEPDDVTLWGMLLSGRVKTFGRDYAYGTLTFGDGVGRYRGGSTALPDENGELQRRGLAGVMGATTTSGTLDSRRTLVFSSCLLGRRGLLRGRRPTSSSITPPSISSTGSCQDRAWAGVEYLHGGREVFGGQERVRQSDSIRGSLQPPVVVRRTHSNVHPPHGRGPVIIVFRGSGRCRPLPTMISSS